MPDFEVGQGVYDSSGHQRLPSDRYGLVVGVQDKTVQVVHVLPRRMHTRFWDESEDSRDSFKDNILLHCDELFSDLRGHAYNDDCYAVADMGRAHTVPKDKCGILDGGEKIPQEDLDLIMDHLSRTTPQRDLLQEDVQASRKPAGSGRRFIGCKRPSDDVPEPEEDLEAVETVGQRRQRQSWAAKLEEGERQKAKLRAGPERVQAAPAEEPSLKSRLAALEVARKAPGTGHGGHGGLGE